MAYINLSNVGVTFSIYNAKTRSLKGQLIRAIGGNLKSIDNTIYVRALDNINLTFNQGERIGLVGHNGAGKSTLLKILAGVYEPTEGSVEIKGYISSLTDITMGMDGESTGYQNIIMRCVFMGMTFQEAREKAKEIIEFSELGDYIYLPARTYSTGMYLRLAFAIATSITPDILIMDEMLGAGDAAFIEKARQRSIKMIERTKILVMSSHDMQIMRDICNIGIWMERGKVKMIGKIDDVISAYHS